jgi:extradiol dioxygenase family protein
MFIRDPAGNHLEFKSFKDDGMIFDPSWTHGPPEA